MTAPERIWVSGWDRDPTSHWWHDTPLNGMPIYIRADAPPEAFAALPQVQNLIRAAIAADRAGRAKE